MKAKIIVTDGTEKHPILTTEANEDWLKARRLLLKAKKGDVKAQKEYDRMDSSLMQVR